MHSLKARLRNNFNVALAQIGGEDKCQKAVLAIVGVERSSNSVNSVLSGVVNFIGNFGGVNIIDYEMEII